MFETLNVFCPLPVGANGKVTEVQLLFDLQHKYIMPEIIICDERIPMTPGFLERVGFTRMQKEWNPSDRKALATLLQNIKNGILSLNQLEFEQKLKALLNEEGVASYVQGEAIAKAVSLLQKLAAGAKYASGGVEVNVADFEKNLAQFRHYINCRQLADLRSL